MSNILKDFKNATLASMYIFLPEDHIFPITDIEIDKSDHLACIRCQDQNVVADGCQEDARVTQN